jgi:hypothetical protein
LNLSRSLTRLPSIWRNAQDACTKEWFFTAQVQHFGANSASVSTAGQLDTLSRTEMPRRNHPKTLREKVSARRKRVACGQDRREDRREERREERGVGELLEAEAQEDSDTAWNETALLEDETSFLISYAERRALASAIRKSEFEADELAKRTEQTEQAILLLVTLVSALLTLRFPVRRKIEAYLAFQDSKLVSKLRLSLRPHIPTLPPWTKLWHAADGDEGLAESFSARDVVAQSSGYGSKVRLPVRVIEGPPLVGLAEISLSMKDADLDGDSAFYGEAEGNKGLAESFLHEVAQPSGYSLIEMD